MLDSLAMAIRNKELKIYDKQLISEMLTFVIQERTGEPRPESGTFSDLIMSCAIAYQMLDEYPVKAQWAPTKHERNEKFLPQKAEGFIVEHPKDNERSDWREA